MMKHYATEYEIVTDDNTMLAKLRVFDGESFTLTVHGKVISPEEIRYIADVLEGLLQENRV